MADLGTSQFSNWRGCDPDVCFNGGNLYLGVPVIQQEIIEKKGWKKTKRFGLAAVEGKTIGMAPKQHFLTFGSTRGGKGASFIIPNLLVYQGSCLVIDPKGENAWVTAQHRREVLGQKTIIIDPWGEVQKKYADLIGEKETVSSYNPLSILDPSAQSYADDLAYLADALIINQGKEPHWDDSARELVAGLMAYAVETKGKAATLKLVKIYLSHAEQIAKEAQELGSKSLAARKLRRFTKDIDEIHSIISTAETQLVFLDSETLDASMMETDFSFDAITEPAGCTIYLVLPTDKLVTHGRWLRLMLSIAIRTIAMNDRILERNILFLLDEFGTMGRLNSIAQSYGLMAGYNLSIWAFIQDLPQLKKDYPEHWETFISNSQAISFLSGIDKTTTDYFSDLLGKTTVTRVSQATADRQRGDPNYLAMSDQLFARDLLQASELRTKREDWGVIVQRGNPMVFQMEKYYANPFFCSLARPNTRYPESIDLHTAAINEMMEIKRVSMVPDFKHAKDILEKKGYRLVIEGHYDDALGNVTENFCEDIEEKTGGFLGSRFSKIAKKTMEKVGDVADTVASLKKYIITSPRNEENIFNSKEEVVSFARKIAL